VTVDLQTRYLGLNLRSPLIASASPLTGDLASARLLEEAGAGAIVLPSLFEEEIVEEEVEMTRSLEAGTNAFAEALDYFPAVNTFIGAGERYLARLEKMKAQLGIPVIASLNANTAGGWVRYAKLIQDAGADALELNLYHVAADPSESGVDREAADLALIVAVRAAVTIPLSVKVSPFYSAFAAFAAQTKQAGADGLVLFNRFYQPDLDLETLDVVNKVELSRPWEFRLPLRWLAILRPQLGHEFSLAATSGVGSGAEAVKGIMAGADVLAVTSALLRHGPAYLRTIESELVAWMAAREYVSVDQMRSSATTATVANPSAFERANYMATLHSWSTPTELATS
jgi:dihydroorotate dehydrogenase (fumarate)